MNTLNIPDQFRDTPSVTEKTTKNATAISQDPELAAPHLLFYLVGLLRRANVVEKGTIQLLTSLMTISGDERLVEKIASTEPFPAEFEAEYICHAVGELRQRADEMERWRDARLAEGGETAAAGAAAREARRGRTHAQMRSIFDSIVQRAINQAESDKDTTTALQRLSPSLTDSECLEKTDTADDEKNKNEDPVCSMYRNMTVNDVHNSITDEVNLMKEDYKQISVDHQKIRSTFAALKGQLSWNLLCKCFEEVDVMKRAVDQMTGGNLEYVEPNQLNVLVKKLLFIEEKLLDMDDAFNNISEEAKTIMINNCCSMLHFIEGVECKADCIQMDIALAREISERAKEQRLLVEYCSELIADMISQLGRRMLLLWRLESKLEMLIEDKADKEYFFRIIDEKADKILVDELVTNCFLDKEYQQVCRTLCDYLLMVMKKMMVWIEKLKKFQKQVDCTIEAVELESIAKKLLNKLDYLKKQVTDLEDGYKDYRKKREKFEMRPFKDLSCFADDTPAVMYNNRDTGIPISDACPLRDHIGPEVAFNVCQLRQREDWEYWRNNPCVEEECPRDFIQQIACQICLGETTAPCKHVKRKQKEAISYVDIKYDLGHTKRTEEDDLSDEEQETKKDAREISSSIVQDILRGIF